MNAIDFLVKEHERVRKMFAEISEESHQFETKKKMFESLSHDLLRHETMEHKIWYPNFKDELPITVRHLVQEEKGAERAIKKLDDYESEAEWEKKFLHLKDEVEHHANEEENNLFPEVKKLLSEAELERIGLEMYNYKRNYAD